LPDRDRRIKWSSPAAIWEIFSGIESGVYETSVVNVQNGNHDHSVGLGPERRSSLDAGRTYTLPDFDRQMALSPLILAA